MRHQVPSALRTWFLVHFVVDLLFALPLFLIPKQFLEFFGILADPMLARVVGAALLAIGGASLLAYKRDVEAYDVLLTLKIIWSVSAILGIAISLYKGAPKSGVLFLGLFAVFAGLWIYYKLILRYDVVLIKR